MITTRSATRPGKIQILFREQDRDTRGLELLHRGGHLLDDHRRQALGRLVEQDRARIPHQRARHGQHLAFASRQRAGPFVAPFGEVGEELEEPLRRPDRHAFPRRLPGNVEIFRNREAREYAAILGHVPESALAYPKRLQVGDRLAVEVDLAARRSDEPHDGLERGRLAGAVSPQQRNHLSRGDPERHIGQDLRPSVMGVDAADVKHRPPPEQGTIDSPHPGKSPGPPDRRGPPQARLRRSTVPGSAR